MGFEHRVTLVPGDDSGPELVAVARAVLESALELVGSAVRWDVRIAGATANDALGTPLPPDLLESIAANGVALKGPLTTPLGSGFRSVNVAIRRRLDLYACLRPCRLLPGVSSPHSGIDLVVIRENTEGMYSGIELATGTSQARRLLAHVRAARREAAPDIESAVSLKVISRRGAERIARFAFEHARRHGRRRVTCGVQAADQPETDGLFESTFRAVADEYRDVDWSVLDLRALCAGLARDPASFDVVLLPNLYGDMVSDLTAGLVGGLGMAPSANLGDTAAVFEATHGSAPQFKGSQRLNPTALILAGCLMLDHLGEDPAARAIRAAVEEVIAEGNHVTFDLRADPSGEAATTTEFGREVIRRLPRLLPVTSER